MKKVLALVLAVMMLSTMAFALNIGGSSNNPDAIVTDRGHSVAIRGGTYLPGDKIYVYSTDTDEVPAVNSDNYSLSKLKYQAGRNLVEDTYFDDDNDQFVIQLADNANLTSTKDLEMTFTLKGKKDVDNVDVTIDTSVGYGLIESAYVIEEDGDVVWTDALRWNGTAHVRVPTNTKDFFLEVVTGERGEPSTTHTDGNITWYDTAASSDGEAYGTLEFTTEDTDVDIEVRVYDGDKLYLYNTTDPNKDILKEYADSDAELTFLNFPGDTTFNATATVYMYKDEDSFVYELKNGKLVESNAKWDDDEGCFILKARTLGSYVFSDVELDVTEDVDDTVENPDTGANDVVGIAAALGVVALVSAAAVSLKK